MLEVKIKKTFQLRQFVFDIALDNLISSILGPSGCGKSTLLKCIAGLITPDEGRIVLNDKILFDSEKKINISVQERRVGYCFQNYALFPNMSIEANIRTGLHNIKDKSKADEIFNDVIDRLQLSHILKQKPSSISGGEAQRVALARMLVNRAEIFLFDEVFSSLDWDLSQEVQKYIKNLIQTFKIQSIFVTHNPQEASFLSDKTIRFKQNSLSC